MRNRVIVAHFIATVLVIPAAEAQTAPPADISFGYSFLTDGDVAFPVGVFGDVGVSVSDSFQFVGELARHVSTQTRFGVDVDLNETSFLFGGRFIGRTDSLAAYFQGLVGGARVSGGASITGFGVTLSRTVFALQVGGGVIVPLSGGIGLKLSADYQRLDDKDLGGSNQLKMNAGISFALGT